MVFVPFGLAWVLDSLFLNPLYQAPLSLCLQHLLRSPWELQNTRVQQLIEIWILPHVGWWSSHFTNDQSVVQSVVELRCDGKGWSFTF